ncbi:hypothetical protein BpHYR1_054058, partial [Brachionus plicatilis]
MACILLQNAEFSQSLTQYSACRNEISRNIRDENEILQTEVSLLKLDLNRDNAKFLRFENEIKYLKSENNRLKMDYLDILQSFLACSSDYQNSNNPNENLSISNLSLSDDQSID